MNWQTLVLVALGAATAVSLVVWRVKVRKFAMDSSVFLGEVRTEISKVTWPDKEQLRNATLVILAFCAVVAALIGLLDVILQWILVTLPGRLA